MVHVEAAEEVNVEVLSALQAEETRRVARRGGARFRRLRAVAR